MNNIHLLFLLLVFVSCTKEEIIINDTSETDTTITDTTTTVIDTTTTVIDTTITIVDTTTTVIDTTITIVDTTTTVIDTTTTDTVVVIVEPEVRIDILNRQNREFLDRETELLRLKVKDGNLARRDVTIRITPSDIAPRGALILTTSGFGGTFYGGSAIKNATIEFALLNGLQVLELKWEGEYGWGTDVGGVGYTRAVHAYTKVVEWLKENEIVNTSLLISHGGSGGAMQIAYGLTNFNLEESIDYAILAAGPPTSDLDRAVFGTSSDITLWPDGLLGFGKTDYIQGWAGNGDYCSNRMNTPPSYVRETLEAESIVNDSPDKDYNYEATRLYFLNTDDITNADEQGLLYYDRIESSKEWHYFPKEDRHDVAGLQVGAAKIIEILDEIVN